MASLSRIGNTFRMKRNDVSFLRKQESSVFCVSPHPVCSVGRPLAGQGRGELLHSAKMLPEIFILTLSTRQALTTERR